MLAYVTQNMNIRISAIDYDSDLLCYADAKIIREA